MLSIKNNLRIGLGISLFILLLSSIASYNSLQNLIKTIQFVQTSNNIISDLELAISSVKDAETGQRGYLLTSNEIFLEPYYGAKEKVNTILNSVESSASDNPYQLRKLKDLASILEKRLNMLENAIRDTKQGNRINESYLLSGKNFMDNARSIVKEMQAEEKRRLNLSAKEMESSIEKTPIFTLLAALIAVIITLIFYKKVATDFDARTALQKTLEETAEVTRNRISNMKKIAEEVAKGKYSERIIDIQEDELGNLAESFNIMTNSLATSFKALEEKDWLQSGVAKLNAKILGEKSEFELSTIILEEIIQHTESKIGLFYIVNENKDLQLLANYAVETDKVKKVITYGEGILGQVYASKKPILIDNIEKHNFTISLASANFHAKAILAFPILRGDQVIAVIEIGALHEYPIQHHTYLNEISTSISTAIIVAQNRFKLQELLEETQAQAEELHTQTEELHAQQLRLETLNTELEEQTLKLQASEEELKVQQEELLQSNQELEERSALLEERNQTIQERNLEIQKKAEQLELSTKYKSEFLANMSHELRTPLNSILLLSRLMTESEDLNAEYKEYAEVIQNSGQGLLTLIDEILDLSKIESGKMNLEVSEVPIDELLQELKALFNPIATEKGIKFIIEKNGTLPKHIKTDKLRLGQILKNLISNALKFTSKGSVKLNLNFSPQKAQLQFDVIDTGIGIPQEKQELIFQAFQQADGSTGRKYGGTGLGLSISKELVKILNGNIYLQSQVDVGSKFTVVLPINHTEISPEPGLVEIKPNIADLTIKPIIAPQSKYLSENIPSDIPDDRENIQPGDPVILIIEDDTNFAKTLLDFTRKRNYKGIVAVRGDQGLELAKTYLPKAILLDIQLPIKDGWDVMNELKANPKTKPIPVHMMSSLSMKKESLQKGAVDFIDKPVAFNQIKSIFEKLEHALSKHPKKILIVEENEQHAMALSIFLTNAQLQTQIVKSAAEGIQALMDKEIDCVILDMGVPDKGAYQTLEKIKTNPGLENLPIIVFTGKSISKSEEIKLKQYADSIIIKTAHSYQRILDETALFLHLVEENGKTKENHENYFKNPFQEVLKHKKVLLVDDDVRNIFSITKALETHQMEVISAVDGKDALLQIESHPNVDIILMDMMMPEMDGYETIQKIRKQDKFKQIPILAVTAKAMMGDREKCIAAGASDYISKPIDFDQLISLLRVWLHK